ncbi:MAG: hypothetical protein V4555_09930 [Acidobacteriota bacterium]
MSSACLLAAGCAASFSPTATAPATGVAITGIAHGGRQPIAGARIYLLQNNTSTYAGPGLASSSANASVSLIDQASAAGTDSIGSYVLTSTNGAFSVSNDYTCTPGSQVYLLSLGGDTGAGTDNSASGLMAVLGTCGADFSSATTVNMNELSTIAAAYAIAGFASDATHVSHSGSALAATALGNAFRNAAQLYDATSSPYTSEPSARTTTPGGNGVVPQAQINTLANILAACVNSSGPASTQCSTLFTSANPGANAAPTNTATAAIDLAQHPTTNVTAIYAITGGAPNPFTPWSSSTAPADFGIAITYTGGGITASSSPAGLATDAAGYVWVANYANSSIAELDPQGNAITPSAGQTQNVTTPLAITVNTDGSVWATATGALAVTRLGVTAESITSSAQYPDTTSGNSVDIASDGLGNTMMVDDYTPSFSYFISFNSSGVVNTSNLIGHEFSSLCADKNNIFWVAPLTGMLYGLDASGTVFKAWSTGGVAIATDSSDNEWALRPSDSSVVLLPPASSTGTAYNNTVLSQATNLAIDGAGNLWVGTPQGVAEAFDNSGNVISTQALNSPAPINTSVATSVYAYSRNRIQTDISGNVWITSTSSGGAGGALIEYLGAAVPTCQPFSSCIAGGKLAQRP